MQPDPFHGRFGNNPGLLSYLLATGQPQWGQPGGILGGNPATNPPGTNPGGAPPSGGTEQPPGGSSGVPPTGMGGGGGRGNDSSGYHGSSAGGSSGGVSNPFGGGQWAGPGQVNLGQLGRSAMSMGALIPGPVGLGIGLANMGLRGYNIGQFDGQLNGIGLPGLSFGQTLGGVLGMNSYGSGNWGANGLLGVSNNGDNTGSMGVAPGDALGGYNGQGRPTAIGQISGPFGYTGGGVLGLGGGAGGASGKNAAGGYGAASGYGGNSQGTNVGGGGRGGGDGGRPAAGSGGLKGGGRAGF